MNKNRLIISMLVLIGVLVIFISYHGITHAQGSGEVAAIAEVTGVIVDVRGTEFMPAMSPKIVDDTGVEVYGTIANLDMDYIISVGIAAYTYSVEDAMKETDRVGNKPQIVKAVKVQGAYKADAVIRRDDAELIRSAVKQKDFFKTCNVIFVLS